jgi:hypothetical protein
MVAYNKFYNFVQDIAQGVHHLQSDALTYALTATANPPVATNTVLANITQIAYTNLSPRVPTITSCVQTGGLLKLILANLTLTQSTTSSAAFEFVVLYNATPGAGPLISWWDYGSAVTLAPNDTFAIQPDQTNGILQIQ